MATVSTSTGTYLSNLFNPQVIGQMIDEKLFPNIVFAPLATIDYTLQGRAGDTVTLPYYNSIGAASVVPEGTDIPIKQLTEQTKEVKIKKIGLGVQLTDEALLSGYGDPMNESIGQISASIASTVDDMLLAELDSNTAHVYTPTSGFTPDDIPKALALFGEEIDGNKAIIVSPSAYADLLNVKSWVPASDIAANLVIQGAVGMAYGVQILVSERVKNNFHIVKPGAIAIYTKRDTMVEIDRDIVNQSNYVMGSKLFAPYLYKPSAAIKIVASTTSGS